MLGGGVPGRGFGSRELAPSQSDAWSAHPCSQAAGTVHRVLWRRDHLASPGVFCLLRARASLYRRQRCANIAPQNVL